MKEAVKQARESLTASSVSQQQIIDSVTNDAIQCLEDGTWHVMLKRYIKRKFNMNPEQYREKWGLPADYPFVAKNYSMNRSKIAKKTGLGKK
nr:MucR family transcriptional regulator [Candidatus Enterousia merdequi]